MVDSKSSEKADYSTHRSLGRGLEILETVAVLGDGASLAAVAHRMNLARSTTHYLMQALVTHGYLRQQSDDRHYRLGLKVFRLAGRSPTSEQIAVTVKPVLNELCRLTNESVAIGIFRFDAVTLVATRDTDGPVRVVQSVGAQRPLHCTALGKVLLAWLQDLERSRSVARLQLEKLTPKSIVRVDQFERELRRVRNDGFAIDDEEFIVGARCLAAPVFNDTNEVKMALGVVGPKHRMTHQRLRECQPLVQECARKLSGSMIAAAI